MTITHLDDARTSQGRFAEGFSGNPAGRPKGALNRATLMAQEMLAEETPSMVRQLAAGALAGDSAAARFIISRVMPPARGRTISLAIPEGEELDVVKAFSATVRALADGEITPDEASLVSRVLTAGVRLLKETGRLQKKAELRPAEPAPSEPAKEPRPVSRVYFPAAASSAPAVRQYSDRPARTPAPPLPLGPRAPHLPLSRLYSSTAPGALLSRIAA